MDVRQVLCARVRHAFDADPVLLPLDAARLYAPSKPSWNVVLERPKASELTYINYGCKSDGPSEW